MAIANAVGCTGKMGNGTLANLVWDLLLLFRGGDLLQPLAGPYMGHGRGKQETLYYYGASPRGHSRLAACPGVGSSVAGSYPQPHLRP
jgi:hypothetical protein